MRTTLTHPSRDDMRILGWWQWHVDPPALPGCALIKLGKPWNFQRKTKNCARRKKNTILAHDLAIIYRACSLDRIIIFFISATIPDIFFISHAAANFDRLVSAKLLSCSRIFSSWLSFPYHFSIFRFVWRARVCVSVTWNGRERIFFSS